MALSSCSAINTDGKKCAWEAVIEHDKTNLRNLVYPNRMLLGLGLAKILFDCAVEVLGPVWFSFEDLQASDLCCLDANERWKR